MPSLSFSFRLISSMGSMSFTKNRFKTLIRFSYTMRSASLKYSLFITYQCPDTYLFPKLKTRGFLQSFLITFLCKASKGSISSSFAGIWNRLANQNYFSLAYRLISYTYLLLSPALIFSRLFLIPLSDKSILVSLLSVLF